MKKHLLLAIMLIATGTFFTEKTRAQAQMENSGFEEWDTLAYYPDENPPILIVEPKRWSSLKSADQLADAAPNVCFLSDDAHTGNYSVHLVNIESFAVANGMMTTGRVHAEMDKNKAYAYTIPDVWEFHMRLSGRPDSVAGWYKYLPQDGDKGSFSFDLHMGAYRKPPLQEDSVNLVGSAEFITPDTNVTEWTRFSVPFTYFKADTLPEYVLSVISSGNGFDAQAGSEMWVDDLVMIYNDGNTTSVKEHPISDGKLTSWYAAGVLNIELKKNSNKTYHLSVMDMMGRTVYTGLIPANERKQLLLDQTGGIYIVRVSDETESFTKKVFIR